MKILILGSSGFIGGHICQHLKKRGDINLFSLSRHGTDDVYIIKNYKYVSIVSLTTTLKKNQEAMEAFFKENKFDIVINAISYGVNYADQDIGMAKKINAQMVENFYILSSQTGVTKFIHFGSSEEYGKMNGIINEGTPLNPVSTYGVSKQIGINSLLKLESQNNTNNLIVLRLFSIFGTREGANKLIPYLLNAIKTKSEALMTGGLQMRNYLYIDDLLGIIDYIINNLNKKHELIYNVASNETITIRSIAQRISLITGEKINLSWGKVDYREGESFDFIVNTDKLDAYLNYKYQNYSFEDGLWKIINEDKNEQ